MPRVEREGVSIESVSDIENITHDHEGEFARYLLYLRQLNEGSLQIRYESTVFVYENGDPQPRSHMPDFLLVDMENGQECFIELTTSQEPTNKFLDPKARQKNIIDKVSQEEGLDILYAVLYAAQLQQIQDLYPELGLNFFKGRNDNVNGNFSPK